MKVQGLRILSHMISVHSKKIPSMWFKGFKVARVEQTETQEQCKERQKNSEDWKGKKKPLDKFEKQTRREVCRVETPG